jgi:NTP pyrophosphatase (non-canonical NTP hydrolase)
MSTPKKILSLTEEAIYNELNPNPFYIDLNPICSAVAEHVREKGFHTPTSLEDVDGVLAKLMLVVTEIGEAAEAVRHGNQANFNEELADAVIRIYDLCGHMGIDLGLAIDGKMTINAKREPKHGKLV